MGEGPAETDRTAERGGKIATGPGQPIVKKCVFIFCAVTILAVIAMILGVFQTSSRRARAATIQIGDSKQHVEGLLGEATMVTPFSPLWRTNSIAALFCDTAETWAYGSRFGFRPNFPWVEFSLFLPAADNITVEFSTAGRVVRVTIP